jgi:hypothetical protein
MDCEVKEGNQLVQQPWPATRCSVIVHLLCLLHAGEGTQGPAHARQALYH